MINKFKSIKTIFLLSLPIYLFMSCNSYTEERIDRITKLLPNGKKLMVEKTNKETTKVGIFTKHNYGTSHNFTYKISINPNSINWDGGSGEPKYILFCKDTTYIHYLKEKSIEIEYTDSIDNTIKSKYHFEIQEAYQKHIDERYFFNIFGNDYWVDISPENYNSKRKFCEEYPIPNDNELSLKPVLIDSQKK